MPHYKEDPFASFADENDSFHSDIDNMEDDEVGEEVEDDLDDEFNED